MRFWKLFFWLAAGMVLLCLTACSNSDSDDKVLTGLTISGPTGLIEGETATFSATADWDDNTTTQVTAVWRLDPDEAAITAQGALTAPSVETTRAFTITASHTAADVTMTDTHMVTVENKALHAGLLPTLISITSVRTDEVATDGERLFWTGLDRQGIFVFDGLETRNITEALSPEYYPGQFVSDGRYTAFISSSKQQLFFVDRQAVEPAPVLLAETTDRFEYMDLDQGKLVWIDNADDILYYADLNSTSSTPEPLTDGVNSKIQVKIDNGLVVWSESSDRWRIFYYDLQAADPAAVQPSGQTSLDHWFPSVDDRFIVWQGSDSGSDVEIFYCDLQVNPLAAVKLTSNTTDDRGPQVHDKIIAWNESSQDVINFIDMNAAVPSIGQLPTALNYDRLSMVRDGIITWTAYTGSSISHVFYYDLNQAVPSIVQLTNNVTGTNFQPCIDSNKIIWYWDENDDSKIYAFDIATSAMNETADLPHSEVLGISSESNNPIWLSRGSNRRLFAQAADSETLLPVAVTPVDMDVSGLDIDNGIAVFRSYDGSFFQIYYCDLNAAGYPVIKISEDNPNTGFPKIKGNIVAWNGQVAGGIDQIFYADLASAAPMGVPIAVAGHFNNQQNIDGGIITWLGGIYPNYEVYYYDTEAATPQAINLTNNTAWESDPRIDSGVIVFNRESVGNNTDVVYHDLYAASPVDVHVTNSGSSDDRVQAINDGVIAWTGTSSGIQDIYFYDLGAAVPEVTQVTTDGTWKSSLALNGGKLVWSVGGEIYGYDIYDADSTVIRMTNNTLNEFSPKNKGDFIIWEGGSSDSNATYAARW